MALNICPEICALVPLVALAHWCLSQSDHSTGAWDQISNPFSSVLHTAY